MSAFPVAQIPARLLWHFDCFNVSEPQKPGDPDRFLSWVFKEDLKDRANACARESLVCVGALDSRLSFEGQVFDICQSSDAEC